MPKICEDRELLNQKPQLWCPSFGFQRQSYLREGFSICLCCCCLRYVWNETTNHSERSNIYPASKAEQPWLVAAMVWGERECLTSLLSVCSLSVSLFCRDELQEDGVGPKKRICHPLSFFCLLWSTHMHCKCQWKCVHLLLPSTETG